MKLSDEMKNTGPEAQQGHTPEGHKTRSIMDPPTESTNSKTQTGTTTGGTPGGPGPSDNPDEINGDIAVGLSTEEGHPDRKEDGIPPRKPQLSNEQQLWLNKVFIPNFRRELIKSLKPEDLMSKDELRKFKKLDETVSGMTRNDLERRSEYDKILQKKDEAFEEQKRTADEEHERLRAVITEVKVDKELISAASRYNSVNPAQVAQLLKGFVSLDEGLKPVIFDEEGERAVNSEGKFMTIDEKVRLFLEINPHLVRASGPLPGSGANDSVDVSVRRIEPVTGGDLISEGLREERHPHGERPWRFSTALND